ncbi:hypothetical protein [Flavobacterium sp.]|uniref:hypothetical protein n=1 Tax=Flavobacterium sp. TaxID=239 RepID=UPI00391DD3C9
MAIVKSINRIVFLYLGKNNNKPNKTVFIAIKPIPISGNEPPYSLRMVLKKDTYSNNKTNPPKTRYPQGLSYFELDKNSK